MSILLLGHPEDARLSIIRTMQTIEEVKLAYQTTRFEYWSKADLIIFIDNNDKVYLVQDKNNKYGWVMDQGYPTKPSVQLID